MISRRRILFRKFRRDDGGAALMELSVVLPVLFAIGLGVIEFGNAFYNYHLILNGVRDGARYASGLEAGTADNGAKCIALAGTVAAADCNAAVTPSCTTACRVDFWDDAATEVDVTYDAIANDNGAGGKLYRGGDEIDLVTVTATVSYAQLGFLGFFGLNAPTFSISHQERVIGVR